MLPSADPSPVGQSHEAAADHRSAVSEEYRRVRAELAAFERLARVVISRRAAIGLSQRELADRMGTTASVISRIESGQHATSIKTLARLAHALDASAVVGLRYASAEAPGSTDALVEL